MSKENQTPEETQGTEVEETTEKTTEETETNPIEAESEADIDYKTKFSESSREAQRLLDEDKANKAEIERLKKEIEANGGEGEVTESLYPGFENLSKEEQDNLLAYTNSIKKNVASELYKDPAISSARKFYSERKWDEAFEKVSSEYPDIAKSKSEFKSKYYKPDVEVPNNIDEILTDLTKSFLYDKARDTGAKDALEKSERIDIERAGGGDKTPKASRTLEDWQKLQEENPAKFASMSKEFNEDMESGRLK